MEYEHGAVSCFAWCSRMSNVHPELLEVQKLRGGCKMLQVCLVGSLTHSLVPFFGKSFKQKVPTALLLRAVLYTTKRMEPTGIKPRSRPGPFAA